MDKNKSAVESFLGDLGSENKITSFEQESNPLINKEEEGNKEVIEEEKPLPFHKDPKVAKFIEKEVNKRLETFKPEAPQQKQSEENSFKETMDAFTNIIGNDTPEKVAALNALSNSLNSLDKRASEKAIAALDNIRQSEINEDKEAEDELNEAFDSIEDQFDVDISSTNPIAVKTRQEFITFVEKIAPKDKQGNIVDYPDMLSAWETFSENRTKEPNKAKELANRSITRTNGIPTNTQERVNWNKVDEFMDTLKG